MLLNKEQLAMNLCYLAKDDYSLLNEIIVDYVMNKIDNNEFNHYEDYVNTEMRSIHWPFLLLTVHSLINTNRTIMKLSRIGYNQTLVVLNNDVEIFFSYDTPVAGRSADLEYFKTDTFYSKTTSRHINKYLDTINNVSVIPQEVIDNLSMELPANITSTEHNS